MNKLTKITAGKTVVDFLEDINDNFDEITKVINSLEDKPNVKREITIDTADPNGGSDGDIWIVYEQN